MAQISGILLFVLLKLLATDLRDLVMLSKHSATRLHPWFSIAFCRWPCPVTHFLNMPGLIHATFGAHEQQGLDFGGAAIVFWVLPFLMSLHICRECSGVRSADGAQPLPGVLASKPFQL